MAVNCDQCSYSARCNAQLKLHHLVHHSDLKPWVCSFPECKFRTKTKSHLQHHKRTHETNLELRKPFPCTFDDVCKYRAPTEQVLRGHVEAKHTPRRTRYFPCPLCPFRFYVKQDLRKHIPCHVREISYKCKHCNFRTHLRASLRNHTRTLHENPVRHSCSFPNCKFSTLYSHCLTKHNSRIHHDDDHTTRRPFPCSYSPACPYRAKSVYALNSHLRGRHNPNRVKNFTCPMCPQKFLHESSVRVHVNAIHLNETNYACDKCNFITSKSGDLSRHRAREHEGKDKKIFKCELCDYRAKRKQTVERHKLTAHSDERRFVCDQAGCGFKTNTSSSFNAHMLLHEKEPEKQFPFLCSFPNCDYRRRLNQEIKRHERQHETCQIELQCKLCPNMRYPDPKSLYFHECLNHNKRSHKCSMCDYSVGNPSSLRKHIRKFHDFSVNSRVVGNIKGCSRPLALVSFTCLRSPIVVLKRITVKIL